jgi:hypothetical protein
MPGAIQGQPAADDEDHSGLPGQAPIQPEAPRTQA